MLKTPLGVEGAGVPCNAAVPLPLSTRVTPAGRAPASLSAGVGKPVVVTVNDPSVPSENAALFVLVMVGAWFTVSVTVPVDGAYFLLVGVNCTDRVWLPGDSTLPEGGEYANLPITLAVASSWVELSGVG